MLKPPPALHAPLFAGLLPMLALALLAPVSASEAVAVWFGGHVPWYLVVAAAAQFTARLLAATLGATLLVGSLVTWLLLTLWQRLSGRTVDRLEAP